jgi:hypothetical protein
MYVLIIELAPDTFSVWQGVYGIEFPVGLYDYAGDLSAYEVGQLLGGN